MLQIQGKPILEHIIIHAKKYGFYNFVISTHYLSDTIKKYFGNGRKLSVNLQYIEEEKPLGTAGSLAYLSDGNDKPIVVANGDIISQVNFQEFLRNI